MPNVNNTTDRGWPLPHPNNVPLEDVQRISTALMAADSAITAIEGAVGSKANLQTETKNNLVSAVNEVLNMVSASAEIVEALGLYIDNDGDLAQRDAEDLTQENEEEEENGNE